MKNLSFLSGVRAENNGDVHFYEHYINTKTDATHLIDVANGEVVYTVTSDGYLLDKNEKHIGKFKLEFTDESHRNYKWVYKAADNEFNFTVNSDDLIRTEAKLFAQLLKDA